MPISQKELLQILKNAFPDGDIVLKDAIGDSNHYSACIKSKQFNGKTKIFQHKMVYDALAGIVGGALHAIQIKTEEKHE